MTFPLNAAGERLLKSSEGLVLHAYPDPESPLGLALRRAGLWFKYLRSPIPRDQMPPSMQRLDGSPWTAMYGDTLNVQEGDRFTPYEAERRLIERLERDYIAPMRKLLKVEPTPNQLAGLACLVWNIGVPAFARSTVLRCHNNYDFAAAGRAFALFNKARGKEVKALVTRRAEEAALYLRPDEEDANFPVPMPQAVEPESKLTSSPIAQASSVMAVTSVAAGVARDVKAVQEGFGDLLPWALAAVGVGAAVWAILSRKRQREGGWA